MVGRTAALERMRRTTSSHWRHQENLACELCLPGVFVREKGARIYGDKGESMKKSREVGKAVHHQEVLIARHG